MPKIKPTLNKDNYTIIEKVYNIFGKTEYIMVFYSSFNKLNKEEKLSLTLEHIKYSPFINALNKGEYQFFIDLVNALPQERHQQLLLLYDDNIVIKKYISSILSNDDKVDETLLKVNELLLSILPETVNEVAQEYIKNLYKKKEIDEEYYINLTILFNYSNNIHQQALKNINNEMDNNELFSNVSEQDVQMGGVSEDSEL